MPLLGLSLFLACAAVALAADTPTALDCLDPTHKDAEKCAQRADDVVAISPGSSYVAKIACKECPYTRRTEERGHVDHEILKADQVLVLNFTLSHDNHALLLNDRQIYPLQTLPIPPTFYATQFQDSFSYRNLSSGIACSNPYCRSTVDDCVDWCENLPLSAISLDYLYIANPVENRSLDRKTLNWEILLDIIGGKAGFENDPHWKFDSSSQKALRILLSSQENSYRKSKSKKDTHDDLFAPISPGSKVYQYSILDISTHSRLYTFSDVSPPSMWGELRRFFGADIWIVEGRKFLYLEEQWGTYGKLGTLRNAFGGFIHWNLWFLVFSILGSTIGGIIILSGFYRLYPWLMQQRELANWDGMENVWARLRGEPVGILEGEEDELLVGVYRDDPDEPRSSRLSSYTDEPRAMKPLPSKPLPEKPLPDVPLIDA